MKELKDEKELNEEELNEEIESNLDAVKEELEDQAKENNNDFEEATIMNEFKKCQQELENYKNMYLRLNADFQNYKKRTEKEKSEIYQFGSEKIIVDMLPIMDNLERALGSIDESDKNTKGIKDGIQMVYRQFKDVLSKHGVQEIESLNQEFDPSSHHAVIQEENEEAKSNIILDVYEKGYKLHTRVIRPSMVKVSK